MQIDLAKLPSEPALLQQAVRELAEALATRDAEVERLRALIKQLQRSRFGRRSEQLALDQLQLGLEDLEQAVAAGDAAQEAAKPTTERSPRRPPTRRSRGALPAHLPRIEIVIDIEDKACPCCGGALHVIGEDRSETLDVVPAQYRVKVIRRPRYGCRACEGAVVQAPAPERPIDGGPPRPPGRVRFANSDRSSPDDRWPLRR
jgi:transposase